eukprot:gnl/Spiro4/16800_TR9038_c0_g1_i1.p1 gnl/Spiro4/16800_TR9038_c0_g1~~gnl/Spiro4/16800_TR9038_c0_g1_i1.p1  ORF type:complete len:136 (-),score=28.63 gnl/Spiro4/16800_TR9038_c0_g1_i1:6-413(-)
MDDPNSPYAAGVDVRPSTISGAGLGLFATRNFETGECVVVYSGGPLLTVDQLPARLSDRAYVLKLRPGLFLNPPPTALACRINDNADCTRHNVIFDKRPDEGVALVVAKRPIVAGEELFVDYGRMYWLGRRHLLH